ncbi:MAG TPA: ABC transporter ATP-binding protein [Fimbriimonadaceae bacterium]|nr:ABC transporter ATP-binding protein [Fimbriimonadaceae bacterium]HRJ33919.1 ABC transporter ATP-binding protein [Fimbriimonadaceae bacterium]
MKRLFAIHPELRAELARHKRLIVLGLICSGIAAGLTSATVPFVKFILEAVEQRDATRLAWLSLGVVGLFGVKYWFTRGQTYYLSKAAATLTSDLRIRLFQKLQRLPMEYFNSKRSGEIQSVLTNDVNVFQSAIQVVRDAIDGPIKIVLGFAMVVVLQWQLALSALAVIPVLAFVIQRNGRKMKVAQAQVQDDLAAMTAMMQESLQGTRIIKTFAAEDHATSRFQTAVHKALGSQVLAIQRVATLKPTVELIGAVALAIVVLLCGVLASRGELQVSDLGAFILGLDVINQGAKNLGSLNQNLAQIEAAHERIRSQILNVPEPQADPPQTQPLPVLKGRIEFEDVHFQYPDGTPALRGVSFIIEPGTSLALVGPSGAGKSTIADLLLRFYNPTQGRILIDGVDLRELPASWVRSQIGVVPQQTFLFAGTVRDNLLLGSPDATDDEMWEALDQAHAGFVRESDLGLESELGERGVRLSGGEGQRLAIARALVKKPRIMLLDEATSNLDVVSEKAVQQALDESMASRTTLFIAHRLSTASRASKIVVLRQGEVLEQGSPEELLSREGAFAAMYRAYRSGVLSDAAV